MSSKQIFVNLPVSDLKVSTDFYEALGFTKNDDFSDDNASCMVWSDSIFVMLLTKDFYASFLKEGTQVADTATTSGVLLALPMDSKDQVQAFADAAAVNGGGYFKAQTGIPEDMMFGYEVADPDGNTWEPVWMNAGKAA